MKNPSSIHLDLLPYVSHELHFSENELGKILQAFSAMNIQSIQKPELMPQAGVFIFWNQ